MGGDRQKAIQAMFEHPTLAEHFDLAFTPGVEQRSLRNRAGFIAASYKAGLIPELEYEAFIKCNGEIPTNEYYSDAMRMGGKSVFDAWNDVPIDPNPDRRGSKWDVSQHYTAEFWRKAKSLGRDRPVLACTLAHLIAMRKCVAEEFDVIIEDNVRVPVSASSGGMSECARRIRDAVVASEHSESTRSERCGIRYFGWLGSLRNLQWVMNVHAQRYMPNREGGDLYDENVVAPCFTFPFPTSDYFGPDAEVHVGGTAIWGAYAYWISAEGHKNLIETLQQDVGSLLWRGKRMRNYVAKPVDKLMPRIVLSSGLAVQVSSQPTFFRAPMVSLVTAASPAIAARDLFDSSLY
jgi:GR25 family glycosyltransferase involved in LPS biosynthesis